jgi:TatD DNase family protein
VVFFYLHSLVNFAQKLRMKLIDTHTHIFLEEFDSDREKIISKAIEHHINKAFLPNIDSGSIDKVLALSNKYPEFCYPLAGLHPTSVKENFTDELKIVMDYLDKEKFYGIGETGIDLYWDKTYLAQQQESFKIQIDLAKKYKLPIIIHVRESFNEVFEIVDQMNDSDLKGIFHCFSGTYNQAQKIIGYGGFKLGIGGVVTFKNSSLDHVISKIDLEHLVLETDAPYLAPVPFRGQRNECSYLIYVAQKIADIYSIPIEKVAEITSRNAICLFNLENSN